MARQALTAPQRTQRRHDLALAAQLLRRQIDADLMQIRPAADRVLIGVGAAWWLRRHWPLQTARQRRVAAALAALSSVLGLGGIGRWALRHRRWVRAALLAWRLWSGARR